MHATQNIADTLRSVFTFEVKMRPLRGPNGEPTPHYGLFRSDNGESVGNAVSSRYEPHTVDDVVAATEAAVRAFDGRARVTARWRDDGHHVVVAPTEEYQRSVAGTDIVWPRLVIAAGYRAEKFRASLGLYRTICTNLGAIGVGENTAVFLRHTNRLRERMPDVVEAFGRVAAGWDGAVEQYQALAAKTVSLPWFVGQVFPVESDATDRQVRAAEERANAIRRRVQGEREKFRGSLRDGWFESVSAWEAYNGVQGYLQHDARRRKGGDALDRALAAYDDQTVARALQLAISA